MRVSSRGGAGRGPHVAFVAAALLFALLGGLLLALALPIDALARGSISGGWTASAQVHGHLQTVGFVGLFIVGMAYRLLPGFAGFTRLRFPGLVWPSFWLLAGGVLARTIGQPGATSAPFAAVMAGGAAAEAAGAVLVAVNIAPMSWHAARAGRPFALFFLAGTGWFLLQAVLGAIWLAQLATIHGTVLAQDRDGLLVFLQLFGFHLMFILGVGIRSFPVLFATHPATMRRALAAWAPVQVGIAMLVIGALVEAWRPGRGSAAEDAGAALAGVGLVMAVSLTGWWRAPTRVRPASRPFTYTLQPAMAWLAVAGCLLSAFALDGLVRGGAPTAAQWDAVRHVVAIGVVLMTIVGMAQLIVPELATERLAGRQGAWRGIAFGVALSLAVVVRSFPRLLPVQLQGTWVYWGMAVAALTAIVVLALLAFYFARGVRNLPDRAATTGERHERPGPPREDW